MCGIDFSGALKRHIFYNTFDRSLLDRYLRFLAEKRLVRTRKIGKNLVYDATDRGKEFLGKYSDMKIIIERRNLEAETR